MKLVHFYILATSYLRSEFKCSKEDISIQGGVSSLTFFLKKKFANLVLNETFVFITLLVV